MSNAVVFAYCGEDKEVLWFFEDDDPEGAPKHRLFTNMSSWLANGDVFTILEYYPNGEADEIDKSARAIWWDDQLRNLGYDIDTV